MDFDTESWYANYYSRVNASAIEGSFSNKLLHRLIEKGQGSRGLKILEVGANRGEHIKYVAPGWSSYIASDIRNLDHDESKLICNMGAQFVLADVENLQFENECFDRVISTCLLHHLSNPELGLREMLRVTKSGGTLSILVPNDPGIMYRLIQKLTTYRNASRVGIGAQARLHHAREHRNHYPGLITFIHSEFVGQKIRWRFFPFGFKSFNCNVLTVVHVTKQII